MTKWNVDGLCKRKPWNTQSAGRNRRSTAGLTIPFPPGKLHITQALLSVGRETIYSLS